MDIRNRLTLALVAMSLALPASVFAFSGGAPAGRSGGAFPGERSCASAGCHSGDTNGGNVAIAFNGMDGAGYTYTPGETITILVTLTDDQMQVGGFQVTARQEDGCSPGGAFGNSANDLQVSTVRMVSRPDCNGISAEYLTHSPAKPADGGMVTYEVEWTAPAASDGPITFAAAGNGANGNGGPGGDAIYTTQITIEPGAGGGTPPAISSGGVVDAAGFRGTLAPGMLASIFGSDLTTDMANAPSVPLPDELGGAQVTVSSMMSPMLFGAPTQINFQVPYEVALGDTVDIEVIREGQMSGAETVAFSQFAPGIFTFQDASGTTRPIVTRQDFSLITEANPAMPGDVLIVWITGVGGIVDPPATGAAGNAEASSVAPVVTLGGTEVAQFGAALAPGFVGLTQVAIQLPDTLPAGSEAELVVSFDGNDSQTINLPIAGS